jgi:hypothetical protein
MAGRGGLARVDVTDDYRRSDDGDAICDVLTDNVNVELILAHFFRLHCRAISCDADEDDVAETSRRWERDRVGWDRMEDRKTRRWRRAMGGKDLRGGERDGERRRERCAEARGAG